VYGTSVCGSAAPRSANGFADQMAGDRSRDDVQLECGFCMCINQLGSHRIKRQSPSSS
jgi:hypothetical protein